MVLTKVGRSDVVRSDPASLWMPNCCGKFCVCLSCNWSQRTHANLCLVERKLVLARLCNTSARNVHMCKRGADGNNVAGSQLCDLVHVLQWCSWYCQYTSSEWLCTRFTYPAAAKAPEIFCTSTVPAIPLLPTLPPLERGTPASSPTTTISTSSPVAFAFSTAIPKLRTSPV